MRILETVTLVLLLPPIAGLLGLHWLAMPWLRWAWALAALMLVLHVVYEGPHWQVSPLYGAVMLVGLLVFMPLSSVWVLRLGGLGCLFLVLASVGASWVLPMFKLPQPTGNYPVGTTILYMVDKSRPEIHPEAPQGPRELMVQIWYPAEQTKNALAPYRRWVETTTLSSYMAMIKTHSRIDPPVAPPANLFPVLLFSSAWKGPRTQSLYEMEDLASHGFIVASIDHPYNSQPIAFPDGRVLFSMETRDIDNFTDYTTDQALAYANGEANYEAEDNRFVLDQLAEMNLHTGNRFFAAMDTDHAGAFGHSFGGGVAMQTALTDRRVLGAINYDGWTFGDVGDAGLAKPFMMMYEPYPVPTEADLTSSNPARRREAEIDRRDQANIQRALEAHGGYRLSLPTAKHMNFADRSLYSPLRNRTDSGSIAPERAHQIIQAYTLAFFSKLLKGHAEPLLEAVPSVYPEAHYEVFPRH
jgi:predicted dienelactone hydrolase